MFCSKCGAPLNQGTQFCTSCGAQVANNSAETQQTYQQPTNTYPAIKADNRVYKILSYLGVLVFIPMLTKA